MAVLHWKQSKLCDKIQQNTNLAIPRLLKLCGTMRMSSRQKG